MDHAHLVDAVLSVAGVVEPDLVDRVAELIQTSGLEIGDLDDQQLAELVTLVITGVPWRTPAVGAAGRDEYAPVPVPQALTPKS